MILKFVYLCSAYVLSATAQCDDEGCRSARIVGGEIAEQNSRPYQVALYARVGTTGELGFCGASLIHQEWVLTAAHCCFHKEEKVDHVQAILGAHSLYDRYEHGRRVVNVAELVVHPDWDPVTFANDIALLRLANVVQLTETVSPVRLLYRNISSFNFAGMAATMSGWGIAAEGVTFVSPVLRQRLMPVIIDSFCNGSYFNQLPETVVCTLQGATGTCKVNRYLCISDKQSVIIYYKNGDNGGPMTIRYSFNPDDEGEDLLIGVTSFVSSTGCNDIRPSVFTRVQLYLDWISEVTGMVLL